MTKAQKQIQIRENVKRVYPKARCSFNPISNRSEIRTKEGVILGRGPKDKLNADAAWEDAELNIAIMVLREAVTDKTIE